MSKILNKLGGLILWFIIPLADGAEAFKQSSFVSDIKSFLWWCVVMYVKVGDMIFPPFIRFLDWFFAFCWLCGHKGKMYDFEKGGYCIYHCDYCQDECVMKT